MRRSIEKLEGMGTNLHSTTLQVMLAACMWRMGALVVRVWVMVGAGKRESASKVIRV